MMRSLALLCAALLLAGCPRRSAVPVPAERVRVTALSVAFVAENEARLSAALAVFNASDSPQQLADIQWELWLDERPFASGVRAVSVPVAPSTWAKVEWTAPLAFRSEADARVTRTIRVGLRGSVHAYTGGFEEQLKFQHLEAKLLEGAPAK